MDFDLEFIIKIESLIYTYILINININSYIDNLNLNFFYIKFLN